MVKLTGPGTDQLNRFLGVDVFWALCMSVNVYLALFRGWTAQRMRTQEWKYFVGCYGCALVPAIVYLFVQTEKRGRVYGPAVVSRPEDFIVILLTIFVSFGVGLTLDGTFCASPLFTASFGSPFSLPSAYIVSLSSKYGATATNSPAYSTLSTKTLSRARSRQKSMS